MLFFFVLMSGFGVLIRSNPIFQLNYPRDINSNDPFDVHTNFIDRVTDDTLISNGSTDFSCSSDSFSNDFIGDHVSSNDDFHYWQKRESICRSRMIRGNGDAPRVQEPDRTVGREDVQPQVNANPKDSVCPDPARSHPLTCAGPEAYATESPLILNFVGNCEEGE